MNDLFNLDNPFMQFLSKISDLILLNLIFLLSCIPLITIGASMSALYYMCLRILRGEDTYIWNGFWKAFRENFKQSTILWILSAAIFLFISIDFRIISLQNSPIFSFVRIGLWAVSAVLFSMFLYLFPIVSHFKCTLKQAIQNSVFMAIGHLPFTLILLVMFGLIGFLFTVSVKVMAMMILVGIVCGFSVVAFTACIIFDRIFKKYEPEQESTPKCGDSH